PPPQVPDFAPLTEVGISVFVPPRLESDHMSTEQARLGRYVIESELGRGAMGVVYRARDPRIDRLVALKTLVPDVSEEALVNALKERFLNEGRAAGRLSHPGVVAVHDADEDAATGTAYLAMEFVDGPDLRRLLK